MGMRIEEDRGEGNERDGDVDGDGDGDGGGDGDGVVSGDGDGDGGEGKHDDNDDSDAGVIMPSSHQTHFTLSPQGCRCWVLPPHPPPATSHTCPSKVTSLVLVTTASL